MHSLSYFAFCDIFFANKPCSSPGLEIFVCCAWGGSFASYSCWDAWHQRCLYLLCIHDVVIMENSWKLSICHPFCQVVVQSTRPNLRQMVLKSQFRMVFSSYWLPQEKPPPCVSFRSFQTAEFGLFWFPKIFKETVDELGFYMILSTSQGSNFLNWMFLVDSNDPCATTYIVVQHTIEVLENFFPQQQKHWGLQP